MNKEVIINISGLQLDAGTEEPIELMTTGDYYLKNGKHYVIYDELTYLLHKYKPESMAVEQLFFTSNQKTVIAVGQARGVIVLAGKKAGVPIYEYTPLQVKQSVVGYGRAVKKQVMEMTRVMLGLEKVPKPDDTADALAIAICHAHSAGSLLNKEKLLQR